MSNAPWYDVLLAVRRVSRSEALTSESLADETGLEIKVASAWLSKFCRYGYVVKHTTAMGSRRWVRVYKITKWGMKYKPGGGK